MSRITVRQAIDFHGHLGPYLILGILAGEYALLKLKSRKYFGIDIAISGAAKKPKSCFIDGIQLSTGATYGKGNIRKIAGKEIRAHFINTANKKNITIILRNKLKRSLDALKGHKDSEILARRLYAKQPKSLFTIE